jgi:hypothetical protein
VVRPAAWWVPASRARVSPVLGLVQRGHSQQVQEPALASQAAGWRALPELALPVQKDRWQPALEPAWQVAVSLALV